MRIPLYNEGMEAEQLNTISNSLSDLLEREQALRGYL